MRARSRGGEGARRPPPAAEAVEGVRIRAMRRADVADVMVIERATFGVPWSEATFLNLLRRRNTALLVAEGGERGILGYAVLWVAGGEAELGDLAVREGARRRGVGSGLLARALEEARRLEATSVFLEVRAGNEAARRLYERAGFEVAGVRPRYYVSPVEDALVMRRSLAR